MFSNIITLKSATVLYLKEPFLLEREEYFGWRPMTNNNFSIINFTDKYENLLIAAGYNMIGTQAWQLIRVS